MKNINILRLRISLLSVFVMLLFVITKAERFEVYPFSYEILSEEEKTVTLIGGSESIQDVIIGDNVEYEGTIYKVVSVAGYAFYINSNIRSVVIPNSISSIGDRAFAFCSQLETVEIGNSLEMIGGGSFVGTKASFQVDSENPYFSTEGGILYNKDVTELIYCMIAGENGEVIIPETVEIIGKEAFDANEMVKEVTIPSSVKEIRDYAFYDCLSMESVICLMPTPTWTLGLFTSTNYDGNFPCNVYVPESSFEAYQKAWGHNQKIYPLKYYPITEIKELQGDFYLNILSKEDKLIEIYKLDSWAFPTEVEIPEELNFKGETYTVTMIGWKAFYNRRIINKITLPSSIEFIGSHAFSQCTNLKTMIIHAENPPLMSLSAFTSYEWKEDSRINVNIYVPDKSLELYNNTDWRMLDIYPMSAYEEENGVEAINSEHEGVYPAEIYSLDGTRVTRVMNEEDIRNLEKGIYIINGKKIFIQ